MKTTSPKATERALKSLVSDLTRLPMPPASLTALHWPISSALTDKQKHLRQMKTQKTDIETLAEFLDCDPSDLTKKSYTHYGLAVYSLGSKEYAIGTDSEADQACEDYIRDSAWEFNASFILHECGLPSELEECLQAFQSDKCESANDAIVALIEKCRSGGMEKFAKSAISADGRSHFLNQYDGVENEHGSFYIYRIN